MLQILNRLQDKFRFYLASENTKEDKPVKKPSLFEVLKSVLAAMIGVQSDENRERDFKTGSASDYIIIGIIFIVIFIVTLMMVVSSVVENS